jgi:hypothetical protein
MASGVDSIILLETKHMYNFIALIREHCRNVVYIKLSSYEISKLLLSNLILSITTGVNGMDRFIFRK